MASKASTVCHPVLYRKGLPPLLYCVVFGLQEGKKGRQYGWETRDKERLRVFKTHFGKNVVNWLLGLLGGERKNDT